MTEIFEKVFKGLIEYLSQKYGQQTYTLKSYKIHTPCMDGDNFLSQIFAISYSVKITRGKDEAVEQHELIAKSQLLTSTEEKYFFNFVFAKEINVYIEVLERMANLLQKTDNNYASLGPKFHYKYDESESYACVFMDNLSAQGYYLPETHGEGLTLDEANAIMKAIAKFHALSLVMEAQDGVALPQKNEVVAAEAFLNQSLASSMSGLVQFSYEGVIQLAEKYRPDLVPFMSQLDKEESVWDRLCKLVQPGASSFACLCHGDARLNNIFLQKDDISNVRFIDFQMTRYSSPLTDLQYILHMGTTKEFRDRYTDTVLQTYFEEFTSVLRSFPSVKLLPSQATAVTEWTIEKLKEEYEAMTMFGFLMSMTLLPIILIRPGDIEKSVGVMSSDEREDFWKDGRKRMVFDVGNKHTDVRERLFDICDEAFALSNRYKAS